MEASRPIPADPHVAKLLTRARERLDEHYGPRLAGLVLHGSVARGTAEPESDIDLLVLLRDEIDPPLPFSTDCGPARDHAGSSPRVSRAGRSLGSSMGTCAW